MSNSQVRPDFVQDRRANTSELAHSSSATTDWKSLAEKATAECAQAKATIGDLFLKRLQTAKRIRELEDEVKNLRHQIVLLEAKPPQTTSSELDDELQGAVDRQGLTLTQSCVVNWQVYSKYADSVPIAKIIDLLFAVNKMIFQAATFLGESLVFRPRRTGSSLRSKDQQVGEELLGKELVNMLLGQANRPQLEVNPFLAQVTLQVFLVSYCTALIKSWCPDAPTCAFLSFVYGKIGDNEDQEIIGTWRAVTRTYTPSEEIDVHPLLSKLSCILRLAYWQTRSSREHLAFSLRLDPILQAVDNLRLALGTKFTSADLEVSIFNCGQIFVPRYMEDAYKEAKIQTTSRGAPHGTIIGTTSLGLKQAVKERAINGDVLYKNVVSAEVVLQSALLTAVHPTPQKEIGAKTPDEVGR